MRINVPSFFFFSSTVKVGGNEYKTRLLEFVDLCEQFYHTHDVRATCHGKLAFKFLDIWQLL